MGEPTHYKDLETVFKKVLEANRNALGEIILGDLKDFHPQKVKESGLKFVVRDERLFTTHGDSFV